MKHTLLLLLALLPHTLAAQTYRFQDLLNDLAASLDEEAIESSPWQEFVEELQELHEHPVNINTATPEQLQRLPFLSDKQIEDIQSYIYLHGAMQTMNETMMIPSLSAEVRQQLRLFLYAEKPQEQRGNIFAHLRHEFTARADIPLYQRKGQLVKTDGYRGSGWGSRMRYAFSNNHLQFNFHTKKDAGEPFFDSHGGFAAVKDIGCVQTLIVGDYRAAFGEGLVMGNGSWNVKTDPSKRRLSGLRPMSSYTESGFLRGVGSTLRFGRNWQVSTFFSRLGQDATLTPEGEVKTFVTSGYHRTTNEYEKTHNTHGTLVGGNITWAKQATYVGTTGYYQTFDRPLNPGTEAYRRIYPQGEHFGVVGVHYGTRLHNIVVGGETSFSTQQQGVATLHRLTYMPSAKHTLSVVQRYYNEHYYSFHASAMGEGSRVQNENGVLLNWQGSFWRGWNFSAYADFFFQRWPTYGMKHSNAGQELMGKATFSPNRRHQFSLSYRWKNKEQYNLPNPQHKVQAAWMYASANGWNAKVQGAIHQTVEGCGYGLQSVVGQNIKKISLRWYATGAYAHTPTYLSRIYFYEPTLYQSLSSLALYGHCVHAAVGLRWMTFKERLMLEARYSMLRFLDREEQSSGLQTIFSPWKNDVQLLLRVRI